MVFLGCLVMAKTQRGMILGCMVLLTTRHEGRFFRSDGWLAAYFDRFDALWPGLDWTGQMALGFRMVEMGVLIAVR